MHKFFFLAGLHRSGNTVLSAILNQNPQFYVSPLSPLLQYMWLSYYTKNTFEISVTNPMDSIRADRMIIDMPKSYYADVNKPYIFERNKAWANPGNINLIRQYIDNNPKIVVTVRPLRECVASFINVDKELLMLDMKNSEFPFDDTVSENDNLVNYILNGNMLDTLFWINESLSNPDTKDIIHLVKYDDLLNNPDETLNSVYKFLELDEFKHDFQNIKVAEKPLDEQVGISADLHGIRSSIGRSSLKVEDVLSEQAINACNQMDLISINHIK